MSEAIKRHIIKLLEQGSRLDGRKQEEYRKPLRVEYGTARNAEGSATVYLGDTIVMAGVKMSIEKPYPDTPEEGSLMVGEELLPLSNPEFEMGPPGIQATELGRVVDRGIRESKAIDMAKLCIEKGEKAWGISIDICPLNDAGNLFDASALAAIAALKDTKMPKYDGTTIDYKEKTSKGLPLNRVPLSVTVSKIGNFFIIDPLTEEEKAIDARVTVATNEKGELCALQKGGEMPLTAEEINSMVELGIKKCDELRKAL